MSWQRQSPARRTAGLAFALALLAACYGSDSIQSAGVEFTTSDAQIRFNGRPATESDLRVGDTMTISGVIEDGRGRAERIMLDRRIDNPIAHLPQSADGSSFTGAGTTGPL